MANSSPLPRCGEARLIATDQDLRDAKLAGVPVETLTDIELGFESPLASDQISAAIALKAALIKTCTPERLEACVGELRRRVAMVRGLEAQTTEPMQSLSKLEAEALTLLEALKLDYIYIGERDRYVARIRRWCLIIVSTLFLVLGGLALIWNLGFRDLEAPLRSIANSFFNYAILMAVAAAGAVISIMQRTQAKANAQVTGDPVAQISGLQHGLGGILVAGLAGPALAILLVPLFSGDMLQIGQLTPTFVDCAVAKKENALSSFRLIDHDTCLSDAGSSGRLLVWAFAAGFMERLVPDVLDRIMGPIKARGS